MNAELVRRLADVGARDRPVVGGKGASLGEMASAGIPVPSGYVVTAPAFEHALAALFPGGTISQEIEELDADDSAAIARTTAAIRERIEQAPLPDNLRLAITDLYHELSDTRDTRDTAVSVAIRSSATSEDSADASFAGIQDTYLWVSGHDAVIDRVRRCWASLYSVESVTYRRRHDLPERQLAMAVVVQRMVDPRSSGVMFTRSPTTGDRSVIAVEGSWGLGSAVVSGEVTPDTYLVNKVTGEVVNRSVSIKRRQHRMNPVGTGVVDVEVPDDRQGRPCLSDEEVQELVRLAQRVESHYETPQDIEWAISRDAPPGANIFLLQSRPESVWWRREAAPVAAPKDRAFDHVFEMFSRQAATGQGGGAAP